MEFWRALPGNRVALSLDTHSHASCATKRTGRAHDARVEHALPQEVGVAQGEHEVIHGEQEGVVRSHRGQVEGLHQVVADVPPYAQSCRRSNYTHESEVFSLASSRSACTMVLHGTAKDDQLRPSKTQAKSSCVMSSW